MFSIFLQGIWVKFTTYQKNLRKIYDQSLPSRPAARGGESILVHWQSGGKTGPSQTVPNLCLIGHFL